MGDRFYLCENKILCEYDYEERLVFANMAYNPSNLAHIRRQVSNLQVCITIYPTYNLNCILQYLVLFGSSIFEEEDTYSIQYSHFNANTFTQ